jgi:hypothetical protein
VFLAVVQRTLAGQKNGKRYATGERSSGRTMFVIRKGQVRWLVRVGGMRCGSITFAGSLVRSGRAGIVRRVRVDLGR